MGRSKQLIEEALVQHEDEVSSRIAEMIDQAAFKVDDVLKKRVKGTGCRRTRTIVRAMLHNLAEVIRQGE